MATFSILFATQVLNLRRLAKLKYLVTVKKIMVSTSQIIVGHPMVATPYLAEVLQTIGRQRI